METIPVYTSASIPEDKSEKKLRATDAWPVKCRTEDASRLIRRFITSISLMEQKSPNS
jgi:hypothetical protein